MLVQMSMATAKLKKKKRKKKKIIASAKGGLPVETGSHENP